MDTKLCSKCKIQKSLDNFHRSSNTPDKLRLWCRECTSASSKEIYLKNKNCAVIDCTIKSKRCSKCHRTREIKNFLLRTGGSASIEGRSAFRSQCKQCIYGISKKARQNRKPTMDYRIRYWKTKAVQLDKEWSVSDTYLKSLPLKCYYTGMDLTLEAHKLNTISLDRVDSSKDYIEGNVVFCCSMVNKMKNNLSVEQFVNFCEKIVANKQNLLSPMVPNS